MTARHNPKEPHPMNQLTDREHQVLALAANGHTNRAIGSTLHPAVSGETVNRHLAKIYNKLGARDRAHAVALGFVTGILTEADINTPAAVPA